ncbi:MAG: DUF983 domain-containing protein [Chitinophagaceae bacterium]|nr:MAG: DUF983 domain-containing protein [Chitinophagaceae bacterium]
MAEKKANRVYLASALGCRCPRCREGKLFKNSLTIRLKKNMEMNRECPVCGQPTEIEVGFYYGTSYVSYALTVAISVATLVAWWVIIGLGLNDNRFFAWLIFNSLFLLCLQPWLMRISRSLWISWFVSYDPEWETTEAPDVSERINPDQANNW